MKRECNMPAPQHNGKFCTGLATKTVTCGTKACPVDGGWGPWTEFGTCSLSCGGGAQTRTRVCNRAIARNGGKKCDGLTEESRACNTAPCPIDGMWGEWKPYSECDENGLQTRKRDCDNPAPKHNGAYCNGVATERRPCREGQGGEGTEVVTKPSLTTASPYIDDCLKEDFMKCYQLNGKIMKMGCFNQTDLRGVFKEDMQLLHDDSATGAIGGGKRIWKCYGDYLHNLLCDCYKRAKDNDMKLFSIASIGKCYGSNDVGALFYAHHDYKKTGSECYQTNEEYKKCYINKNGDRDGCGGLAGQKKKCEGDAYEQHKGGQECEGSMGFEYVYAIVA